MEEKVRLKPVRLFCDHFVPENCNFDNPPIIFIHGLATTHRSWKRIKNHIARDTQRQVYAVDLRNHGQSEWSDIGGLDAMVTDVENFMSLNGMQKAVIIGHSMGGKLATKFTLAKPELVSKVVVEEVLLRDPTEDEAKRFITALKSVKRIHYLPKSFSEMDARKFILSRMHEIFPGQSILNVEPSLVPLHKDDDGTFHFDFNALALQSALEDGTITHIGLEKYQPVNVPALFVYGKKSNISTFEDTTTIMKYFPTAEFCKMLDAGHQPHSEFPDEFTELVSRFINAS